MEVLVYKHKKDKNKFILVKTKVGSFIITEKGILGIEKDIDFGEGAIKKIII